MRGDETIEDVHDYVGLVYLSEPDPGLKVGGSWRVTVNGTTVHGEIIDVHGPAELWVKIPVRVVVNPDGL